MTPEGRRETSVKEKQDWLTERTLRRVEGQQKVWTSTPPQSQGSVCVHMCVCMDVCVRVCVCVRSEEGCKRAHRPSHRVKCKSQVIQEHGDPKRSPMCQ